MPCTLIILNFYNYNAKKRCLQSQCLSVNKIIVLSRLHNGNKYNHGNCGNRERNNAKSNNNNSNNNYKNNSKTYIIGKGTKNGQQHSGTVQVNSVEEASMADYVNKLVLTSLANAKYNMTLMMACIMLILLPMTSATLPPSYEVEPCDQPMAPAFYALAKWDVKTATAAQFRVIPPPVFQWEDMKSLAR